MWTSHGPFNVEALQAYGRQRQAAVDRWKLESKQMASVMEWVDSALMSPDAFLLYRRGFDAFMRSRHDYVAVAWVGGPDVEGLDLMCLQFAPLFEEHALPFRVFDRASAALAWVRPLLFATPATAALQPAPDARPRSGCGHG
ncbi:hypothetical protein [Roseateles saccharophilus]|nr:hypothetical protein [Roseateles saccharophilus]MDG0832771.1 hypothetical protein [Roseateles saccharophilus]